MASPSPSTVPCTTSCLLACQFHHWYPRFTKHTFKSIVLRLSPLAPDQDPVLDLSSPSPSPSPTPSTSTPDFVRDFLETDGLVLPDHLAPQGAVRSDLDQFDLQEAGEYDDSSEQQQQPPSDDENSGGSSNGAQRSRGEHGEPFFPTLIGAIDDSIERLGGAVLPKLNWSSPKDARWIACGETLRCASAGDVLLLLKASDFCAHDVAHAFDECVDAGGRQRPDEVVLVLRKWSGNLLPSREFRCFVRARQLLGVSQRHHHSFFPELGDAECEDAREAIMEAIQVFFEDVVLPNFAEPDFVFDVYVDKRRRVWVMDFNPYGSITDALLFDWPELVALELGDRDCELRVQQSDRNVQEAVHMSYRFPIDAVDLASKSSIDQFVAMAEAMAAEDSPDDSPSDSPPDSPSDSPSDS